jgi:hypothetical protein
VTKDAPLIDGIEDVQNGVGSEVFRDDTFYPSGHTYTLPSMTDGVYFVEAFDADGNASVQSFGPSDWICAVERADARILTSAVAEFVKLSDFSRRSPDGDVTADAVDGAGSVWGANQRQAIAGDLPADGRLTAYAAEGAGSVWGANQRALLGSERPSGHVLQRLGSSRACGSQSLRSKGSLALACARGVPLEDRGVNDGTGDGGAYYNA